MTSLRPYGFLGGIGRKVVLGIEEVGRVVRDVGKELERRGMSFFLPLTFPPSPKKNRGSMVRVMEKGMGREERN